MLYVQLAPPFSVDGQLFDTTENAEELLFASEYVGTVIGHTPVLVSVAVLVGVVTFGGLLNAVGELSVAV
jgi:hypothetical protein